MVRTALVSTLALALGIAPAFADVSAETLESLSAPDSVQTRIGTLEFKDGVPTAQSAQSV